MMDEDARAIDIDMQIAAVAVALASIEGHYAQLPPTPRLLGHLRAVLATLRRVRDEPLRQAQDKL